jgi:hypothetical protein
MRMHWRKREAGEICRRQLKRRQALEFFARRSSAVDAMEVRGSADFRGRKLTTLGNLILDGSWKPPHVKPVDG